MENNLIEQQGEKNIKCSAIRAKDESYCDTISETTSSLINSGNKETKNVNYFEIKELGLKFEIKDDIKDLVYSIEDQGKYGKDVYFSTKSLIALDKNCEKSALGVINVNNISAKDSGLARKTQISGQVILESNGLYIYILPPTSCSDKKFIQDIQMIQYGILVGALRTTTLTRIGNN